MQYRHWAWVVALPLLTGIATAALQEGRTTRAEAPDPVVKRDVEQTKLFCSKASEVIGREVRNRSGEKLGKVEELVIDPASGSIEYAVISFGGFLGMGDKLFAVPSGVLETPEVTEKGPGTHFLFEVEKSRMEKAPGFDKDNWPDVRSASWRKVIDTFYGTPSTRAIDRNREFRLCKASEVIGQVVADPKYVEIGEIRELVLDPHLADGAFSPGISVFAIPWPALEVETKDGKDTPILDVTRERLEKAPRFVAEEQGRTWDPVWLSKVYRHYGVRPYWEVAGPGE